ncbi:MAG: YHS domain-containing (seleno)protein [Bacteroidia bacterium]
MSAKINIISSLVFLVLLTSFSFNDAENLRKKHFNTSNNLAIKGYDPVAYFTSNKAILGDKKYAVKANGILYYCSSASNMKLFLQNYNKYEPQFGGWCAYAMGNSGEKVSIDPKTFKLINGKLYLFYNLL